MMKTAGLATAILIAIVGSAFAQHPMPAQPPGAATPHVPPMQGMQGAQGGMCGMMGGGGGMMAGGSMPMMGMMMGAQADSPRNLQMRGEMMKAMGEIMMKYGKAMESAGR